MTKETREQIDSIGFHELGEGITFEEILDSELKSLYHAGKITQEERWEEYGKFFPSKN